MHDKQNIDWLRIQESICALPTLHVTKDNCILVNSDARLTLPDIPSASVDCIITSPPYVSLKDYGVTNQLGFGQKREAEYLPDLQKTLLELFRTAKSGAALWIVVDTVKDAGHTVPLPLEVITRARESGWIFHDLVIWDKGKNLPWSNQGHFRGVCEHVLLFSKEKLANFNLNAVRDVNHLSSYWVEYPERYHPDGKAPSDLWHFPIPVQGGWSNEHVRHFCPFPIGLVARMISITTKAGDIVMDPFSGTGSVIATASHLGRLGVGIEINSLFVQEFDERGFDVLKRRANIELPQNGSSDNSLRKTIIELRMLKYAKTLFAGISRSDRLNGKARASIGAFLLRSALLTKKEKTAALDSNNLGQIQLEILLRPGANASAVTSAVNERIVAKPLSIFGIRVEIKVLPFNRWSEDMSISPKSNKYWYVYRKGRCYKYDAKVTSAKLLEFLHAEATDTRRKVPSIISQLKVAIERPVKG